MATSRMVLLQKAVRSITSQDNFRRRWVSCTSIQKAVFVRYIVKGVQVNKRNFRRLWFSKLRDNYYPGDIGFYPLALKSTDPEEFAAMQTNKLQVQQDSSDARKSSANLLDFHNR